MSDEQAPRRGPGGEPGPDATRQFSPFDDSDQTRAAGNHPDDGPRSGDAGLDRTQQMPRTPAPGDDATVPAARDATSVMPPVRDGPGQDAAWSGRAEVRPPRQGYTAVPEWDAVPPPTEPRGRWWMPILIGILALLLIGALIWGVYLIAQNSDDAGTPAPAPSVPVPTAATTEPTTPPTSTAPPTTTPTTTEPTGPTEVTVPALVGLSQEEAQQALDRRGLSYRLLFRPSDAQAGTVIDSDPAGGQEVPPDTQVTLVIAAPATATATVPPTGPTDQPDED